MFVVLVFSILAILIAYGRLNYRSTKQKAHELVRDIVKHKNL